MYVFFDLLYIVLFELVIFFNDYLFVVGYDEIIEGYIKNYWFQLKDYQIECMEQGVILMIDYVFFINEYRIIYVGMVGGDI